MNQPSTSTPWHGSDPGCRGILQGAKLLAENVLQFVEELHRRVRHVEPFGRMGSHSSSESLWSLNVEWYVIC